MSHAGSPFVLDADGYFRRGGVRLVPVGVNYWPASCGVEMWQAFPEAEIATDLDLVRSLGLDTVRFFLRWQDFEPREGEYDATAFSRLRRALAMFRERGLLAHPALFVGFMSGGTFWPAWKRGRNVFADPLMQDRAAAFARQAATVIAEYADVVLAVDHGNELCCLLESYDAPPAAVRAWCERVSDAIHAGFPGALIVSGNEQGQLAGDSGWRLGDQPGTDFYSMHGYPVPSWHPVAFDGMADPLCRRLLPFYTRCARAFGPVMLQEFGPILSFDPGPADAYLRAMLPAAWDAGANGFLYWCLRDIVAPVHPYTKNPFERTLGLVDAENRLKPAGAFFVEFAKWVQTAAIPARDAGDLALYLPKHYYPRDNPLNPGNEPKVMSRRLAIANHLLRELGHAPRVLRGGIAVPADVKTIVVTGAALDLSEWAALRAWVNAGGRLVLHGADPFAACDVTNDLLGAVPSDFRAARAVELSFGDATWPLSHYPRGTRTQYRPTTARVLAADGDGVPQVLVHDLGRGRVVWSVAVPEEGAAAVAGEPAARDRWTGWYAAALAAAR